MTIETFERAIDIKRDIDRMRDIQSALANSKNGRFLAAIEVKKMNGIVVEDCRVLNHVEIPKNIMDRFEEILWEELHKLEKEFEEL